LICLLNEGIEKQKLVEEVIHMLEAILSIIKLSLHWAASEETPEKLDKE
jgi:hypothetical protein